MNRYLELSIKLTFFVSILIIIFTTNINATILWEYDAQINFTDDELYMMDNCNPNCSKSKAFEAIPNPTNVPVLNDEYASNNKCYRVFFPSCQNDDSDNFCKKVMAEPMRVNGKLEQPQFSYGTDIWVAFSVFIPTDFHHPENDSSKMIYQFHAHPDTCDDWRSPPLAIRMIDRKWVVTVRYSTEECIKEDDKDAWSDYNKTQEKFELADIAHGYWTHFALKVRFNYNGNGLCQVWIKDPYHPTGARLLNYQDQIGFNDEAPPYNYVSFGFYNAPWPSNNDITLYFDRLLYGDKNESLEKMIYQGKVDEISQTDNETETTESDNDSGGCFIYTSK